MAGIYVHIPFCASRCHYCSFHSSTILDLSNDVVEAIVKELHLRKDYLEGKNIETIYFGGGTPSLLPAHLLEKIFNAIYHNFELAPGAEITLEANPDDVTEEMLHSWSTLGVNRLSVGFQTFSDRLLKLINRRHTLQQSYQCLQSVARSPFVLNFNLDLIFALPTQTQEEFEDDLNKILEIQPPHISAYMMTFEEKSAFGRQLQRGEIAEQSEDFCFQCFLAVDERFRDAGYEHYEISNFARDGKVSRHNSNYWSNDKTFLGVGPAAASFNKVSRQTNIENNNAYVEAIAQDIVPAEVEVLSEKDKTNEFIFNNLRTSRGLDLHILQQDFRHVLDEKVLNFLVEEGFIVRESGHIMLTPRGMVVSNRILEYFLLD